jgi:tRNA A-37 threonylcarbamoyl transferase component Bud32
MTTGGAVCTACGAPLEYGQQFCTRCGTTAAVAPRDPLRDRLQDLLGAELELQDVAGRGGMAVVYVARDPLLERRVAVKAMLPEFATDAEMAERFLREARTAAQLQHPNIVSVFGVRSRGDLLVMLMAFIEGRSLDAVLHERGPLPLHVVGRLAADVASALQYAHEHKVIHRDVKPANVLLASNGGALVTDFGIARRQDLPGKTGEGMLLGSLAYMSPEQRYGEALTGATDQYALGVSVFEMLTGRGPFVGPPIDVHVAHLRQAPPSVRDFRPDVPDAVAQAIDRMLAKKPAERFPDLREPKRIFERLVTDARSVSAEIAQLSGVLAAPTASRVMSAVRKAPTIPFTNPAVRPAEPQEGSSALTVAAAAPTVPIDAVRPAVPAPAASRLPIYIAVAAAVMILGGAVVVRSWRTTSAARPADSAPRNGAMASESAAGASGGAPPATAQGATTPPAPATGDVPAGAAGARPNTNDRAATVGAPLPAAALPSRPQEPASAPVTPPPAGQAAPPAAEPARPVSTEPAATLVDARGAARALVTLMNQHRARDIERLADAGGGDPTARRTLERLVREATDFAAGFEAMASEPESDGATFTTEFVIDAAWRSGSRDMSALFEVRLRVARQAGAWVPVGYSAKAR